MADRAAIITTAVAITVSTVGFLLYWKYRTRKTGPKVTLANPEEKVCLKLVEKKEVSHDTYKFKFALPSEEHILGLPVGQHIYLSAMIGGRLVVRPYTPVSSDDDKGYVELMVKVYMKGVHPKFPEGGKMSQYLYRMILGEAIDFRGPAGNIVYKGNGLFYVRREKRDTVRKRRFKQISMIAGGSGITPMLQIIADVLKRPDDCTQLALIFANQTPQDILCRAELDKLAREHESRFRLWYTVDRASEDWSYSVGFVDDKLIQEHLFPPSDDNVVLLCGPPPMISFACTPNLEKLAYNPDNRYEF